MHPSALINALLLCLLNISFMVTGIILNSVVIISLRRCSQLRKKLCYFMILLLSYFDLAVVIIGHPLLISSTILWSMQMYHEGIETIRVQAISIFGSFSMFALLTLNIERFLALTFPFFHQTAVTKGKLVLVQVLHKIIAVALLPVQFFFPKVKVYRPILISLFLLLFLSVLAFLNYRILTIAKSKREDELRVAPTGVATRSHQERQNRRTRNFESISTCSLAIGCFFICSIPGIVFSIWSFKSNSPLKNRQAVSFNIWVSTFACMNSTFNCLLFFWRNSILRREGIKIVKCLLQTERWE